MPELKSESVLLCVHCGRQITADDRRITQRRLQLTDDEPALDAYHLECFRTLFGPEPGGGDQA